MPIPTAHRRRWLAAAPLALLGLLFFACLREVPGRPRGGAAPAYDPSADPLVNPPSLFAPLPEGDPERAEVDATLVRRLANSPTTLNPIFNLLWEDHHLHSLLFVWPFRRLHDLETDFNLDVVVAWEESADHLTFIVRLNPDMTWHDGTPWTAYDVEFTYELITDPRVPALFYKLKAERLADVRALDAHTVEYVHKAVVASRMTDMALPVIPRHIFGNEQQRANDPTLRTSPYFSRHSHDVVIGSGPYRLVRWRTADEIEVERWADYPFTRPRFRRQVLKILPDPNIALLLFKKGDLHEMALSPQQFATQTQDPEFARFGVKGYGPRRMVGSIGWNQDGSNPFFNDVRVRRAMAHAFDRERYIADAFYGLYRPSTGIFDPEHWAFNPAIELVPHDLEAAARLLDEAGWRVDTETGWRYKEIGGRRVRFEFEMMIGQGNPLWVQLVNIFSEDLRRLGVVLQPRALEVATLVSQLRDHTFQSYIAVVEVTNDADEWSLFWLSNAYRDGYNYVGYSNPRVDELFALGGATLERDQRRGYYQEIQQILYDEQPFTFIWDYSLLWAFSKRLGGVSLSLSDPFLFYPSWTDWWLERPVGGS